MFAKILKAILVGLFFLGVVSPVWAQSNPVNVYFFWGDGCPHCAAEKTFLSQLVEKYPGVNIQGYEVWHNPDSSKLLQRVAQNLDAQVQGVPFTVIADKTFSGFSPTLTGPQIEDLVKYCQANICPDPVSAVINPQAPAPTLAPSPPPASPSSERIFDLPLLGKTDVTNFSLPLITLVLGALDGFNPCAMWTLLFLISMLIGMHDNKRRWILGTAFITASAVVYFLFMSAWLNLFLFVGFILWVRWLVGSVAIAGGIYQLREFVINAESGCKVTGDEKRQAFFTKLKSIVQQRNFFLALGGIILLAFAVNLVEMICSTALPVIYTQILTLNHLPSWQYYAYMLLYIFFFMLDDLFVFIVSMATMEMTGLSTKYSRLSHLIGGILMLAIGLLLIFKPELLMFG